MRFKLYILISIITHLLIFIFSPEFINKERLKGEKIAPIEIINNESFSSSKGNTNKNSPENIQKKIQDIKENVIKKNSKVAPKKDLKLNNKNEILKGDFEIKKEEIREKDKKTEVKKDLIKEKKIDKPLKKEEDKKSLIKKKNIDNSKNSNAQTKGFSNTDNKKDLEKGSIKGKGNLKITCLNCVSPKYPRKALRKGLEGKPTVKVWILKSGDVEKAEIIISSGINSIDNAALEAAEKSKFYPIEFDSFMNIQYDLKLR